MGKNGTVIFPLSRKNGRFADHRIGKIQPILQGKRRTVMKTECAIGEKALSKEDYEEPRCPLSKPSHVSPIPERRVIEKLDEYLSRNDYSSAEELLNYWLKEADCGNDMRGKLTVLNEQIGLYRKVNKKSEGLQAIQYALALVDTLHMENTVTLGTTLINAATGYKAFGMAEAALPLYKKAQEIYESVLSPTDRRLGGLYNNMALTVMALGNYREAEEMFNKAINIMAGHEHGEAEMAVTYCNLADLVSAEVGMMEGEERIEAYLHKAEQLLDTESLPRDGYYAFICEKCAPTFGYYGFFLTEHKFSTRAREIYERP